MSRDVHRHTVGPPEVPAPHKIFPLLNRRRFLVTGAAMASHITLGRRPVQAAVVAIPDTAAARRTTPMAWLPEPVPVDQLRTFATVAMEAAVAAGADFADIRIGMQRRVSVHGFPDGPAVEMSVGYGIRAWSDGTWSFQHGNVLTPDAVAATARSAVAGARRYAGVNRRLATHMRAIPAARTLLSQRAWAPAPVVTGEWRVPVAIDPFSVPIDDYYRAIGALVDAVAPAGIYRSTYALSYVMEWNAETRIFASTTGSLVTQHTMRGGPTIRSIANLTDGDPPVSLVVSGTNTVCAGFEAALRADLPARIQQVFDDAVRWRELPFRPIREVGRLPVVFDGATTADLIGSTISTALDGDRVSGLEADASGGSFLVQPLDILRASEPQFSPLLSAHVRRTLPSPMAAQWDDDGVVPEGYPVLDRGHVVDFHTTRETAPMLAEWYHQRGTPLRSHGGAFAPAPDNVPRGTGGHLMVAPATTSAGIRDLTRDLSHGFVVLFGGVAATPGLTGGMVGPRRDGVMLEIQHGVPVARTMVRLQFLTQVLFKKNLVALGDATTMDTSVTGSAKGIPWQFVPQLVTAPAALCKDVDVIL